MTQTIKSNEHSKVTIQHWYSTGHSDWVLVGEDGQPIKRNEWMLKKGTRKEVIELALHFANELGFDSIEVEYWYKGEKRLKKIK